jgi:hypothetical protein
MNWIKLVDELPDKDTQSVILYHPGVDDPKKSDF